MGKTILGKVGITPKGGWIQGEYQRLDLVSFAGSGFISLKDNNTALLTDATKWMIIASKGDKGDAFTWDDFTPEQLDKLKGEKGNPGKDFKISGFYNSLSALQAAITNPELGDAYGVGSAAPYPIYVWDGASLDWVNNGAIQGPTGLSGKSARINKEKNVWQEYDDTTSAWVDTEYIAQYSAVTTEEDGLMSKEDKSKLDGIEAEANKYVHPAYTSHASGLFKVTVDATGHISAVVAVEKGDITALGIPGQDTNTVYTHPVYTVRTAGLYKITVDATGHISAVVAVEKGDITALGIPGQDTNTTYSPVTIAADGLMSKTDKGKLDGIATNANNYSHPAYTARAAGLYKITVDATGHVSAVTTVTKVDITGLGIPAQDTVYTHPTGAGNNHIPTGGAANQILRWSASGVAAWSAENNTIYNPATASANGLMTAAQFNQLAFYEGQNIVTTLVNVPATKQSVLANLAAASTLSISGTIPNGRVLSIKCINTTATAITLPLPTTGTFVSKDTSGKDIASVALPPSGQIEINIWALNSKYYIKTDA